MQVKIPGFEIEISKMWAIIVLIWSILLAAISSISTSQYNEYKVQHKIEEAGKAVSGIDKTLQDRIKVNDSRFENLEKITTETRVDVGKIQVGQESMINQMNQITALMAALLSQGKTADKSHPVANSAVYEVQTP